MGDMKYKVGDRVQIKSLEWYNKNKDDNREIKFENGIFTTLKSTFLGQIMTIEEITPEKQYIFMEDKYKTLWTDEMIEGLVEEEAKSHNNICKQLIDEMNPNVEVNVKTPKFKIGDRVITDTNMKGKIIEVVEEGWYRVEFEPHNKIPQPNGIVPEESMSLAEEEVDLIPKFGEYSDNEPLNISIMTTEFVKEHGFPCPDGYIFKDENGNVINATKIVLEKKKKEYPKTYQECCKVMGVNHTNDLDICEHCDYKTEITYYEDSLLEKIETLYRLIICRDAYWKLAGEEMGLGKPWEPENPTKHYIFTIENCGGDIIKNAITCKWINRILVFPTEEMRDAFKENFDKDLEFCKELL